MASFEASYRSAVALNNTGVTLLKRKCFLESQAALADAMDAFLRVQMLLPFSSDQGLSLQTGNIHLRTKVAAVCAATACVGPNMHKNSSLCIRSIITGEEEGLFEDSLDPKDCCRGVGGDLNQRYGLFGSQAKTFLHPMWIDDLQCDWKSTNFVSINEEIKLNTAIAMYNHSLAIWGMVKVSTEDRGLPISSTATLRWEIRDCEQPSIELLVGRCGPFRVDLHQLFG